jgi:CRP-like cAMP-binding protein
MPAIDDTTLDQVFSDLAWLCELSPQAQGALRKTAHLHSLNRGESLTPGIAGGGLTYLVNGSAKMVQRRSDGRESIIRIAGRGELLTLNAHGAGPSALVLTSLENGSRVLGLDAEHARQLLHEDARAALALMDNVGQGELEARQRVEDLCITPVPRRIAHVVVRLGERFGVTRDDGSVWMPLTLSRQDMADMCATSLETAIRVMSRLRTEKVVVKADGGLAIVDTNRLGRIATGADELRAR